MTTTTTAKKAPVRKKPATRRTSVPAPEAATSAASAVDALTAEHGYVLGQRYDVDPRTLVVGANVRAEVGLTAAFLADIDANGVESPIDVYVDTLGALVVEEGQRRTLAAVETKRETVPVLIVQQPGDDEARIIRQDRLNFHRAPLIARDQAVAFEQLALLGRTAESIARSTGHPLTEVEAGLAVASSAAARKATESHVATLTEAAVIAEFDGDTEAVETLVDVLAGEEPEQFAHVVQELREEREERAVVAAKRAEVEPFVRVLDKRPTYQDKTTEALDRLKDTDGGERLDKESHADCPGHAAYVGVGYSWDGPARRPVGQVTYYCTSWKKQRHVNRHAQPSSGATSGPKTEQEKAERSTLIANNKASDATAVVREQWLQEFFQRKDLPKDAVQATAELFVYIPAPEYGDRELQAELTGVPAGWGLEPAMVKATSTPAKATAWLLAWAVARVEVTMRGAQGRQWWRKGFDYRRGAQVAYLTRLQSWGYTPSDLEQTVMKGS